MIMSENVGRGGTVGKRNLLNSETGPLTVTSKYWMSFGSARQGLEEGLTISFMESCAKNG